MTISTTVSRIDYPGAGLTGPYAFPFRILAAADLLVTKRDSAGGETTLALTTDYTIAGTGDAAGSVTLVTALAVGETLTIRRAPALLQPTSLQNQSTFYPKTHEDEFDRLAMQLQSLQDQLDRSFGLLESYAPSGKTLRLKPETGKVLAWQSDTELGNSNLDASAVTLPGEGRTVATVSAFLLNNAVYHAADYLDVAADIGGVINFILAQVGSRSATIVIPDATFAFSTAIDLRDSKQIRITGLQAGNQNAIANYGGELRWTGGAGSGSAVKAQGSVGLEWDHLNLSYNSAVYDGKLFSLGSGGASDTSTSHIHHCRISGTSAAKLAACLVELDGTLGFTIEHTTLDYAVVGILNGASGSNVVEIGTGCWFDKHFSDCQIKARGGGWLIRSVVSESYPNTENGGVLTTLFKIVTSAEINGLTFENVMSVDGGNGGGTIIDLTGGTAQGVAITGGNYGAAAGTFLRCSDTVGSTKGVSVQGLHLTGLSIGVHLGRADGASIEGSYLNCTTPWTGTEPTRVRVGTNHYNGNDANCGIAVVDDGSIAISTPGSSINALGIVHVTCKEDGSHAIYGLNGAAGSTTEMVDVSGHFAAADTDTFSCIYWNGAYTGGGAYVLKNRRGATRTYVVTYIGR